MTKSKTERNPTNFFSPDSPLVIGLGKGVDCHKIGTIAPYFAEDPSKLTAGQAWTRNRLHDGDLL
ncbi:MAG: hypothetical protein IPP17_19330 [Bacteroidetes bacterium]|nr:hypothetical protein [Bacteroidota bacterium]